MLRNARSWLGVALSAVAVAASAESPEPTRYCGDDYYFTITPPPGWIDSYEAGGEGIAAAFAPPGDGRKAVDVSMSLGLQRMGFRDDFDLDSVLDRSVSMLVLQEAPFTIRNGTLRHPSLESRSAIIELPEAQSYTVLMHPQSGRGYVLAAALSRAGGKPSPEQIALFERSLASLRYDAGRICKPDGEKVVEKVVTSPARSDPSADDRPKLSEGQRAIRRAVAGCAMLQQLFVPVMCTPGRLAGTPVLLAAFERSDERSAEQMLETFRDRLAATYCWAAADHPLPRLALAAREKKADEATPIRIYSCEKRGYGETYRAGEFEFDESVLEGL